MRFLEATRWKPFEMNRVERLQVNGQDCLYFRRVDDSHRREERHNSASNSTLMIEPFQNPRPVINNRLDAIANGMALNHQNINTWKDLCQAQTSVSDNVCDQLPRLSDREYEC